MYANIIAMIVPYSFNNKRLLFDFADQQKETRFNWNSLRKIER